MAGQPHKPTKRRKPREDEVIRKMFYWGMSRQIAQIDAKKVNKRVFLEWCALNFFYPIFASSMGIGGETGGGKKIFGKAVKPRSRWKHSFEYSELLLITNDLNRLASKNFDSPRRMKLWDGKPKGAKGDLAAGQSNWHYLDQAIHKDTQDWNTIPVNHRNYLLPRILCINSQ